MLACENSTLRHMYQVLDIFRYLSIFFYISRCIFKCKFIVYRVLHRFLLPDVASASITGFKLVSVVLSVTFTMSEDDEAN